MSKNNAKASSTLHQKIWKYNGDFVSSITHAKQNPAQPADENAEKNEDSEGSSDGAEDGVSAAAFLKTKSEAPSGSHKFLKNMEDRDDPEDWEKDEEWDTGSMLSSSGSGEKATHRVGLKIP